MKQNQSMFPRKNPKKKDKAYFAPKSELLNWVSKIIKIDIKSIEEAQTGAIFCQLLDALHPGTVRMNKVNWKAKLETEYISNFKLFQQGLSNNNIDKPINIQRLSKGKTMELIELLQWLYGHYISLGLDNNSSYDAIKRRNGNNFVYFGQKLNNNNNNINNNNNNIKNNFSIIRDDISKDSSNFSDFKDFFGVKKNNNTRNKKNLNLNSNINSLNANLRSNNFRTNINNINNINNNDANININNSNKNNLIKNKIRGKSEKISINSNSSFSSISPIPYHPPPEQRELSISKTSELNNNQLNNIYLNEIVNSPFIIEEKPEEDEKLNNILFEGINNIDKENILELEKHDGNNIRDLKILIRKLRVNSIIFKSNLGSILNKVTKERDFFLNKLKDIEYLYFNPIIKNTNENKNEILKSILKSQIDSTILINSEGIASIKPLNIKNNFLKNQSKDDTDLINTKINSQNAMKIRISISKVNKDKNIDDDIIMKENININIINNKTQPVLSEYNKKKLESNIFPLKNNCNINENYSSINKQKRDININQENNNNNHVTPSNKTSYYDISSHILNDSLHIPNTENTNPNLNNNNNNLIDFV